MRWNRIAALGLVVGSVLGSAARAQLVAPPAGDFPFYIPWDDATPGTATDCSFLNHRPAGKFGRVIAKDGHFVFQNTGQRVRFFATNCAAESAIPATAADAEAFAAAMAKRGVNLVRLHHLDNGWAIGKASLWDKNYPDRQHLDPAMLDRLDVLIARLIDHGIYVDLNTKVGKDLTAADGFPEDALKATKTGFPMQKRIDHFDRRMIELQKAYARELLTHKNPYTGRRYADEPGVAIVEVNNENGILSLWPGAPLGSGLDALPDPFRTELMTRWNAWLKAKYGTDAAMRAARTVGVVPLGNSVVPAGAAWSSEQQEGAEIAMDVRPAAGGKLADIDVRVPKPVAPSWHAQAHLTGLTLENGKPYTVSFEARSDRPRKTDVAANLDQAPWSAVGPGESVETTPQWKTFALTFTAGGAVPGHVRIGFAVAGNDVPLQVRNFDVRVGTAVANPSAGEALEAANVPFPSAAAGVAHRDFVRFLIDTDDAYAKEMLAFFRQDLGVKALTYVSQVQWGGLSGYEREAASDITDTHAYVGHPQFGTGADWNETDWTIANKSEVRHLAETGRCELFDLAQYRQAGRPFTVSEYDQPAPSDFAAECVPMLAAVAATQDWDAVYTFCMPGYGRLEDKKQVITGFFDQLNHPAKAAFYPFAAVALRRAALAPIGNTATLSIPTDAYEQTEYAPAAWQQAAPDVTAMTTRLSLKPMQPVPRGEVARAAGTPTPLSIARAPRGPVLHLAGPAAAGLVGFVGGTTSVAGPLTVVAPPQGDGFVAITVHTLDEKPVADTARGLVTVLCRAENVDMGWNADRTTVGNHWGTGPVRVVGPKLTVTLDRTRAAKVYALDEHGTRKAEVPATFAGGKLTFAVDPARATVWYEFAD